ncbi:MAG: hypothetical protein GWP08_10150 [Nitrospiraceae bacterium]|nr:hypothetical protein [Nitrospiraceae bacterium]
MGKNTASGGDLCGLYGVIQTGGAFDGENCLRIELGPGETPVTYSDYTLYASQTVTQAAPLAANLGWMDVSVDETYTLSAYMRADRDGIPADLVFRFGGDVDTGFGSDTHSKRVTLTEDWARYSFSMVAYRPDVFVAVGPNLSTTPDASATVWIDAVQLEASPETPPPPAGSTTQTEDFEDGSLDGIWGLTTLWNTEDTVEIGGGMLTFHKAGDTGAGTAAVTNTSFSLRGDFTLEFTIPHLADFAQDDGAWIMPRFVVNEPAWTDMIWLVIGRRAGKYVIEDQVGGVTLFEMPLSTVSCTVRMAKTSGQMVCFVAMDGGAFSEAGEVAGNWGDLGASDEVLVYLLAQDWFSAVMGPFDVAIDDLRITAVGIPGEITAEPTVYIPREPVEIGLDSQRYGNLFDATDTIGLTVFGHSTAPAQANVEIRAQLEDYFGELGSPSSRVLTVPENGRATTFLPLNTPGTGYYRAHVSWNVGGIAHSRIIKMAVVETYPWDDSPFGLNHAPTTQTACQQLKKGGTTWARDWSMKWESVEPVQGAYDFSEMDRQVDRIKDTGLNLLPLLPPQPSTSWASEAPAGGLPPVERTAYAPEMVHRPKLNAFIATSVDRYKDRVTYWEFLNEPLWVPWYCLPTSAGYTVDTYIDLLQGAAAAMKSADPACQVVGGLSIMAGSALGDEFIQKGGLDYVDIYNLHPYPEGDSPESFIPWMQRILGVMDANGGRKPIWATELSYWATDDKPWTPWAPPNPGHWSANRQQASEREAADYNVRQSVILLAHGVEKIFWHSGLEGEVNNGSWDLENPLLDPEAIPQKFFAAQAALARLLGPAPEFAAPFQKPGTVSGHSTSGVHGYAFDTQDGAAMVVWAPGELNNGERRNDWTVPLGESPVYLRTSAMTAQELSEACTLIRDTGAAGGYDFNGWGTLVTAPESVLYPSPLGEYTVHVIRGLDGTQELVWDTQDAPAVLEPGEATSFTWLGATGYEAQPECTFSLFLGGTKLVDFGLSLLSTEWTGLGGACLLDFDVLEVFSSGQDAAGVMTLTIPNSLLTPGSPARLRVVGSDSSSYRWFGIYECAESGPEASGWALEVPDGVAVQTIVGTPMFPGVHSSPDPPIITTNNGEDFTVGVDTLTIEGTCGSDAADIRLNGTSIGHTEGQTTWTTQAALNMGNNELSFIAVDIDDYASAPTVIRIRYEPGHDWDGDGLMDADEVRDLDLETPGLQNPFDLENADSTGDNFSLGPDGIPDGDNDWDGDGMSNALELTWGFDPLDPASHFPLPASHWLGLCLTVIGAMCAVLLRRHGTE